MPVNCPEMPVLAPARPRPGRTPVATPGVAPGIWTGAPTATAQASPAQLRWRQARRAPGRRHLPSRRHPPSRRHLPSRPGRPGAQCRALSGQPVLPAHRAGPECEHDKGGERGHGGRPQPGAGPAVHGGEGRRADDPRADVEQQPRGRRQPRPGDPGPSSLGPHRPLERVPPAADVAGTAFGEGLERRPTATGQRPGAGQDQLLGPSQAGPRRGGRGHVTPQPPRYPFGDREIAVGGKIEDRGRVCGTVQPASGHAQVHERRLRRRQPRPGIHGARPQGRRWSPPSTSRTRAARRRPPRSRAHPLSGLPLLPGRGVLHRSGGTATAVRLLARSRG